MKKMILAAALALLPFCAGAQAADPAEGVFTRNETLDSTVVTASRAGAATPVAHTDLSR